MLSKLEIAAVGVCAVYAHLRGGSSARILPLGEPTHEEVVEHGDSGRCTQDRWRWPSPCPHRPRRGDGGRGQDPPQGGLLAMVRPLALGPGRGSRDDPRVRLLRLARREGASALSPGRVRAGIRWQSRAAVANGAAPKLRFRRFPIPATELADSASRFSAAVARLGPTMARYSAAVSSAARCAAVSSAAMAGWL